MPFPEFDREGNLPPGVHRAFLSHVLTRFGQHTLQRLLVSARLSRIYELASGTGKLQRFIIFGSYVTAKPDPNDVDIILVMRDDFGEEDYTEEMLPVLDHRRSQLELGASIFWTRSGAMLGETVDQFVAHWQVTREQGRRGIVEIVAEVT